jgi:hypothetical protein
MHTSAECGVMVLLSKYAAAGCGVAERDVPFTDGIGGSRHEAARAAWGWYHRGEGSQLSHRRQSTQGAAWWRGQLYACGGEGDG